MINAILPLPNEVVTALDWDLGEFMANTYHGNTWVFDTAITAASLLGVTVNNRVKVTSLQWAAGNSGLAAAISNGTLNIWSASSTANEQNFAFSWPGGQWIESLGVPTLGGGTLYLGMASQ